ncbi:MAG: SWIM zinc finger domain-containing protein [Desulfobacterales bacterium]
MEKSRTQTDPFRELTWGDLTVWVGQAAVAAGRRLQKNGAVRRLVKTPDGGLLAWVQAEETFAAHVGFEDEELYCRCACHSEEACEHGIAVILEYIAHLKKNVPVPITASNDQRFYLL